MDAKLEGLEVETACSDHDHLAIQPAACRESAPERLEELGEVAIQWLLVAALEQQLVAISEDEHAKAIPFRFEDPRLTFGQLANALGEHGQNGGNDGEAHRRSVPKCVPAGGRPVCADAPSLARVMTRKARRHVDDLRGATRLAI